LKMLYESQTAHLGSCLSCIDILAVLYFRVLRKKDKFILSKGHAAASLYAVLVEKKKMPAQLLNDYCRGGLEGHPSRNSKYGIEVSTGSLGHGLPMGIGMALAGKRVFVLMSDGEMDCGTTWEAAKLASEHKLKNLTAIIDANGWQAFKRTNLENLIDKWRAFGWEVEEIDGHNQQWIEGALRRKHNKPKVIIALTIKGKGIPSIEDKLESHYHNLTQKEYEESCR